MDLLTATTKTAAQALAAKALAYATNEQDASGIAWSPVYTDGSLYAITFDASVIDAFTAAELGAVTTGTGSEAVTTYSKVIDGERKQTVNGVTTGTWEVTP